MFSHVVNKTVSHLKKDKDPGMIVFMKKICDLRNHSVEWLVDGYNAVKIWNFVKKVPLSIQYLLMMLMSHVHRLGSHGL